MSIPTQLDVAMQAEWVARGYTSTALIYDFREVERTKELDAVLLGNGRIVYHWGAWSKPESSAGSIQLAHGHAHRAARNFAAAHDIFTVHCHGFDPDFPDASAAGAARAHDSAAWALRELFFGVLQWVARKSRWFLEHGNQILVRDPADRRIGELLRAEFTLRAALREAPEYPFQYPETKPVGAVVGASGDETTIVEVP